MQDFEKLGVLYLGKRFDLRAGTVSDDLLLYDSKDLTTHAVCVGMTGSGKTGLCISLLEEAAIDGIPVIAIDPKGDIANVLLAFPDLRPSDFRPWIDESEAARKGMTVEDFAAKTAENWRNGLAQWGQDAARIQRFKQAADITVYTPGNSSVRPLALLRSFSAPSSAIADDSAALRDRILSAVSGLLGLIGIDADPVQSREHILLSNILDHEWRAGRDLDLPGLIREIQKPPFDKLGVFDLESFFPAKERFSLAMRLNNLIASPGFSAWMEGDRLDIQKMLYTAEGKPRISILSIAHLSDAERMFFVTILLNELIAWMRAQSGTGSLRALLYMDEIFGYFPPTANPPSKTPMLTLLKQARAFGLGVVLSTQNPVDLDYKGLSNAGTWFIGRLQTERDKARVMEGLEGALAGAGGSFDRAQVEATLAGLGNRVFLMWNVHESEAVVFQSRWALSYLRGPLTMQQIKLLAGSSESSAIKGAERMPKPTASAAAQKSGQDKPVIPPDVTEYFLPPGKIVDQIIYRPSVLGMSKLHFVHAQSKVDSWIPFTHIAPISDEATSALWGEAMQYGDIQADLKRQPQARALFAQLPAAATNIKKLSSWKSELEEYLYQNVTLDLFACPSLKLVSQVGETEGVFFARIKQLLREQRDASTEKLRTKYAPKLQTLQDQIRRAEERMEREKAQYGQQKIQTVVSIGTTLLGAFLGRKIISAGTLGRSSTAMKSVGRIGKEKEEMERAGENVAVLQERLSALQQEFEQEIAQLEGLFDANAVVLEKASIRPRKSDIAVGALGIVWVPWYTDANGMPLLLY